MKQYSLIIVLPIVALGVTFIPLDPEEEPAAAEVVGAIGLTFLQGSEDADMISAFAFGPTCFHQIDENKDGHEDFSGWGWTIGPLSELSYQYTFPLYAHAADCDITRGELVGALDVLYENGSATITYSTINGYTLEETHVYAGSNMLARDQNGAYTITPAEFPIVRIVGDNRAMSTMRIADLSGDIYVVAHATVKNAP